MYVYKAEEIVAVRVNSHVTNLTCGDYEIDSYYFTLRHTSIPHTTSTYLDPCRHKISNYRAWTNHKNSIKPNYNDLPTVNQVQIK